MNILMCGEVVFINTSVNLKKGLERLGHKVTVYDDISWFDIFRRRYGNQHFDIVHIQSPNLKKLLSVWRYIAGYGLFFRDGTKLVCHWHGSDLRHPIHAFPVYRLLQKIADFHLYSTLDLRWWLRKVSDDKKLLFNCPVDTDLFKPDERVAKGGEVTFSGGGRSFAVHKVPHEDMPVYLNCFAVVNVHNSDGLDDGLISVIGIEAAACGCSVPQLSWMDRAWVLCNASISVQSEKLSGVYGWLFNEY